MRLNRFVISIAVALNLVSCGFLDQYPTTSLSEETVYASEESLEAGIIGCYASMQANPGWQGEFTEFVSLASGLVRWKTARSTEEYIQTLTMSMFPKNARNENTYTYFYASIYKCNKLIENLPDSPVNQAFKDEIEAEARLIRAIDYFALVRLYGDVPLITRTARNMEDMSQPRVSYMKVYKQIIEDLEYAEEHMRDQKRQDEVTGWPGRRPNKWAATSFKAAVYAQIACLIENKDYQFFDYKNRPERTPDFSELDIETAADAWGLCLSAAESVIESQAYGLAGSYADLFRWTELSDYQLAERVFVLNSTDNVSGSGLFIAYRTLPPYPEGGIQMTDNSNQGRTRPGRYVLQKWASVHGGELDTERADGFQNVYKSCPDPRFDLSYFHTSYIRTDTGEPQILYPSDGKVKTAGGSSEPYFKKYLSSRYNIGNGYADFYLMRYAEVILFAAEAAASLSKVPGDLYWQKALDRMEMIHARARQSVEGGSDYPKMSDWPDLTTREKLVDAIMWERVFELHGEGQEFFDTHRRGAKWMAEWLTNPINTFLKMPEQVGEFKTLFYSHYLPEDVDQLRKGVLLAFPEVEFRNNPAIGYEDQNDFYIDYLPKQGE